MTQEEPSWQTVAAANLNEARKRNGRLGARKSRGGCITCKVRRVKCDETHPACNRCTSTGRRCDGYADAALKSKSSSPMPLVTPGVNLSQGDQRAFDFFLTFTAPRLAGSLDKDFWCGYVLQLAQAEPFVLNSLLAISTLYEHPQYLSTFDTNLNGGKTLRQGAGNDMKIAIRTKDVTEPPKLDEHHANALKAFNRAIIAFREKMERGKATPLLAMLSCALFICIEVIRDNIFAALALFTKGTRLLKQFSGLKLDGEEKQLMTLIKLMFARLGVLAAAFGYPLPLDIPPELVVMGQQSVFANMAEARSAMYFIMGDSHSFIRKAISYKVSQNAAASRESPFLTATDRHDLSDDAMSETSHAVLPATFNIRTSYRNYGMEDVFSDPETAANFEEQERTEHIVHDHRNIDSDPDCDCRNGGNECFRHWKLTQSMFTTLAEANIATVNPTDPWMAQPRPSLEELQEEQRLLELRLGQWYDAFHWARSPLQTTEPEAASSLLMYYHVSLVWLTTRLTSLQTALDHYTYHMQQILHHAEIYVNARAHENPVFTFEVGAVPPLYFVATKCRVPYLRRKALRILSRAPRKECLWGASSTGQIAARLITIEEAGLGLPVPKWDGSHEGGDDVEIDDSRMPAEAQRVHDVEILKSKITGGYELRVTRFHEEDGVVWRRIQDFPI